MLADKRIKLDGLFFQALEKFVSINHAFFQ